MDLQTLAAALAISDKRIAASSPSASSDPPDAPKENDLWVDTGVSPTMMRRWRGADVPTDREYEETVSGNVDSPAFVSIDNTHGQLQTVALEAGCVAQQAGAGDPSPTNIRAISGRESVEVVACGKNLYDANAIAAVANNPENGVGVLTDNLVIGATYTISANADVFSIKISDTRSGYNSVHMTNITDGKCTFIMARNGNIPNDTKQYLFVYPADNSGGDMVETAEQALAMQIQLELGSTATAYEPYTPMGGGVITPSEPLYGLPDAKDTVEVDASGDVTVTRRTAVLELDGTENISYGNAGASIEVQQFNAYRLAVGGVGDINSPVICSHLPYSLNVTSGAALGICLYPASSDATIIFGIPIAVLTQYGYIIGEQDTWVPAFKAYLAAQKAAGTPVTIVYELATPTTETPADVEPIVPEKGQLNISTDADALSTTVHGSGWDTISDQTGLLATIAQLTARVAALEQAAVNESTGG